MEGIEMLRKSVAKAITDKLKVKANQLKGSEANSAVQNHEAALYFLADFDPMP